MTSLFEQVFACYILRPLFVELFDSIVDLVELEGPVIIVEEGSHVKSVVVAAARLEKERRGDGSLLVSVDAVEPKEMLDLGCDLLWRQVFLEPPQVLEHRHWPMLISLPQLPEELEFVVGDSHVSFIRLSYFPLFQWGQFGSGGGKQD